MERDTFEINKRYTLTKIYDYGISATTILQFNERMERWLGKSDVTYQLLDNRDGEHSCHIALVDENDNFIGSYYYSGFTQELSEEKRSRVIMEIVAVTKAVRVILVTAHRRDVFADRTVKIANRSIEVYAKRLQKALSICGVKEIIYIPYEMGNHPIRWKE